MASTSGLVSISCSTYHQRLTDGLWNSFLSRSGVDFGLVWGGRCFGTHRFLLDLFLSTEKLFQAGSSIKPGDDCSVLEMLLKFLYTGQLLVSKDQVNALLVLATFAEFGLLVDTIREMKTTGGSCPPPQMQSHPNRFPVPGHFDLVPKSELVSDSSDHHDLIPPQVALNGRGRKKLDAGLKVNWAHKCSECGKTFRRARNLKAHLRIHTGDKPHQCEVCQKTFTQANSLKYHLRVHAGEKPYKCELCNKTFANTNNLKIHASVHTGEKPHKCQVCGKEFTQANSLKVHLLIHSGEQPYKCKVCQRPFNNPNNLKVHLRVHTGEKPYNCQLCHKEFSQANSLKYHQLVHAANKTVQTSGVTVLDNVPGVILA